MVSSHQENEKNEDEPADGDDNSKKNKGNSFYNWIESIGTLNCISIIVAITSTLVLIFIAVQECRLCHNKIKTTPISKTRKTFWLYGKNVESGYLHNVLAVLNHLGYEQVDNSTNDWDLLWAHDYPFRKLYHQLSSLKPHQKINHFPGCGYITNKVDLAVSRLKYIPPAFKLPEDKDKLLEYANTHSHVNFVQKNNDHRNIKVVKLKDINLKEEGTFIQEFVDKPLLVSGHKFDIGIYTVITSVDPLRIYNYNGDVLLRFCPVKYYPFDPNNLDKYVVGDDYLPVWEVPALEYYYNELGFGMRESLNAFIRSQGKDPNLIWNRIEDSIRTTLLAKEELIVNAINRFRYKRNFFEMMRFDFVVDEDLNVYLLEANMSPNLSSAHFPPNQLLYHQVIYNMFALVGIAERIHKNSLAYSTRSESEMLAADKNIATFPRECKSKLCQASCVSPICQLCKPCLSSETKNYLIEAYREHLNIGDFKRIFPPSMVFGEKLNESEMDGFSPENQLQYRWFKGKCLLDSSWC